MFGLSKLFAKLLDGEARPETSSSRELATARPAGIAARPRLPSYAVAGDMPILHRREIIDDRKRLCGYHFSVAYQQPNRQVSESLLFEVLQTSGVPGFAARRVVVLPVDPDSMLPDRYSVFRQTQAYLQVDLQRSLASLTDLGQLLGQLHSAGLLLGLRGASLTRAELPCLEASQMLFLHLAEHPLEKFQKLMRHVRGLYPEISVVVEGVDTWPEFRMCVAWGAKFCMGGFLTTVDAEEMRGEIDSSHLVSIEMLNLLRSEGDLEALAEVAKKDPAITFKLLAWANSPANGLASTITSLSQAIIILGRAELYRTLTLSMFRMGRNSERNESILEIALSRARLLEHLPTDALNKAQRENLFLVGLFSLFDVLLEVPMAQILGKMQLAEEVTEVLLNSSGPYARYLMLAIMLEKGRDTQAAEIAVSLGMDYDEVQAVSMEAFAWSQMALGGRA